MFLACITEDSRIENLQVERTRGGNDVIKTRRVPRLWLCSSVPGPPELQASGSGPLSRRVALGGVMTD